MKQEQLFNFTDYPECWSFRSTRHGGRLAVAAIGLDHENKTDVYESQLLWDGKQRKWELDFLVNGEDETSPVPEHVKKEMFRQFAAYKARWLSAKRKGEAERLQGEFTRTARRGWR